MLSRRCLKFFLALLLLLPSHSFASSIDIGYFSFDVLIPGGASPGVNVFSLGNLTGDPALGGFALPPDFPAFSSLTLLSSTLTLYGSGSPIVIALGDLGPGLFSPSGFSETDFFSSAVFSGTLDQASFTLDGGGT